MFDLLADAASSNTAGADSLQGWIQVILQTGFAGVMLYLVLFKWVPKMQQQHEDERKELIKDARDMRDSFLGELKDERESRNEMTKESTKVGQNTAVVLAGLRDSVDGLSRNMEANTEAVRRLTDSHRPMTSEARARALDLVNGDKDR